MVASSSGEAASGGGGDVAVAGPGVVGSAGEAATVDVSVKWGRTAFTLNLRPDQTLDDLKREIERETQVQTKRQKLVGVRWKAGAGSSKSSASGAGSGGSSPTAPLRDLITKKPIMMIGNREKDYETQRRIEERKLCMAQEVVDDFDIDDGAGGNGPLLNVHEQEENLRKVSRRVESAHIKMLGEPREGKKLLVLDIDYTLFDHRSSAETAEELRRPFLFEFLADAYVSYDIIIWSATSMNWIEVKMKELGVLDEAQNFRILGLMDYTAMITVNAEKYGNVACKPLGVIWKKFEGVWDHTNTIMFDDLRRNFLMNPRSGLKIRPFKQAHLNRATDVELLKLSQYLRAIEKVPDFSTLDHRKWERYLRLR